MKLPEMFNRAKDAVVVLNTGRLGYVRRENEKLNATRKLRPQIWGMIGVMRARVLGRYGIYPDNMDASGRKAWLKYKPDGANRMLAWQFEALAELVVNNVVYIVRKKDPETGLMAFVVYPKPKKIKYSDEYNRVPEKYIWEVKVKNGGSKEETVLAKDAKRYTVMKLAGQFDPASPADELDELLQDQQSFRSTLIDHARNAALSAVTIKGGAQMVGQDTQKGDVPTIKDQMANQEPGKATMLEIPRSADVEVHNTGSLPSTPGEIDKMTAGVVGRRYHISRMQTQGVFDEANYSSARLAEVNDWDSSAMYSRTMEEILDDVWEEYPGKVSMKDGPDWHVPIQRAVDESKRATADAIRVKNYLKSPQQVIREDGYDEETTKKEIVDWHRWKQENGIDDNAA